MKLKSKHVSLRLPPSRLYLNDILEIESLFIKHCQIYVVDTDKYQYESIKELIGSGIKSVYEFGIDGKDPNISFSCHKSGSSISSYVEKGEFDPFAYLLKDKIVSKSSKILQMATSNHYPIILFLLVSAIAFVFIKDKTVFGLLVSLLMLLYFIYSFFVQGYLDFPRHTIVYLHNKGEGGGFFNRNKDKIILMLLSAIIGSIITLVINYIIKRY